jgi:hypothetical protein
VTWVRIDDGFPEHPKAATAGALGQHLFLVSLCYANRNLTDGHIPDQALLRLADYSGVHLEAPDSLPGLPIPATPRLVAQQLVNARLWHETDLGYVIHDYGRYQPTREQLERRRSVWRRRQRKRRKTAVTRESRVTPGDSSSSQSGPRQQTPARDVALSEEQTDELSTARLPEDLLRLAAKVADADERTPFVLGRLRRQGLPPAAFASALESLEQRRRAADRPPLQSEVRYLVATLKTMLREGSYAR